MIRGSLNIFYSNKIPRTLLSNKICFTWNFIKFNSKGTFQAIGLDPTCGNKLAKLNIVRPTPIQFKTIPKVLKGENVIINSETGSGKTLAYLLPILHNVKDNRVTDDKAIASIILVPNVELAVQVYNVCSQLGAELDVTTSLCIPGNSLKQSDIVIATVSEVLKYRFDCFDTTKIIVLDEADYLLQNQLKMTCNILRYFSGKQLKIKGAFKRPRYLELSSSARDGIPIPQFIFCAATLPHNGRKTAFNLIMKYVPKIEHIKLDTTHQLVNSLKQDVISCEDDMKIMKLISLITEIKPCNDSKILIFVNTAKRAKELYQVLTGRLENGEVIKDYKIFGKVIKETEYSNSIVYDHDLLSFHKCFKNAVAVMHKNTIHVERQRILDYFTNGDYIILISTDLMARGIDFVNVNTVIQFDYPKNINEYVHRAGRTARAGANGSMISFKPQNSINYSEVFERNLKEESNYERLFSRNRMLKRRVKAELL